MIMPREVVLVFDIGKTNKKALLFDRNLRILHEEERGFDEIPDEDGFPADDIGAMETWMLERSESFLRRADLELKGINFATYGASLAYLDGVGNRLTPVYNYLKPMPEGITESLYEAHGGKEEFCRRTASPALGMLNSGFQALWLRNTRPGVFRDVRHILHFPQYLSHRFTGRICSEHTSIGCHTALWDFDRMAYHPWVTREGLELPDPLPVETVFPSRVLSTPVPTGIGIHDSSASLVPYFMQSTEAFLLLSTGTWCIAMNPFNPEPLTAAQLERDCLSYLSIRRKPVKSSRLFMGHIHDVNLERLSLHFGQEREAYKRIPADPDLLRSLRHKTPGRVFFSGGVPEGYVDHRVDPGIFESFAEGYHRLMIDLTDLCVESLRLVIPASDASTQIFVSGGFGKNPLFLALLRDQFPDKEVLAPDIANATSLGAAMVLWKGVDPGFQAPVG
ncbi:MAG: FGGY family carbohydrate kinase [Bacteroidales bacterium]